MVSILVAVTEPWHGHGILLSEILDNLENDFDDLMAEGSDDDLGMDRLQL